MSVYTRSSVHASRALALLVFVSSTLGVQQQSIAESASPPAKPRTEHTLIAFLDSLLLFPPDDTASTLDPANPSKTNFPQFGHGSIKLTVLFNDPTDLE